MSQFLYYRSVLISSALVLMGGKQTNVGIAKLRSGREGKFQLGGKNAPAAASKIDDRCGICPCVWRLLSRMISLG
jgi:hypothetical protein